ncbi:MAG: hypothetical protein PVJ63_00835 [Thioalkalispiraceae bacterium]|jgi:hypothetical protein
MFRPLLIMLLVSVLWACSERRPPVGEQVYPWQIEINDRGNSQVFGIELDASSLRNAAQILGKRYELGLFENDEEKLSLEAYFGEVTLGGLSGKIIVLLEAEQSLLASFRQNSVKRKRQDSGGIKYLLSYPDQQKAQQLVVAGLSYVPYVQLEKAIIIKRFGEPDQVVSSADKLNHYLYPAKGLDLIQDDEGKELLQYVSPRNMRRLLEPLEISSH